MERKFMYRCLGADFYKWGALWVNPLNGSLFNSEQKVLERVFYHMAKSKEFSVCKKIMEACSFGDCSPLFAKELINEIYPDRGLDLMLYKLCVFQIHKEKIEFVKSNVYTREQTVNDSGLYRNELLYREVFVKFTGEEFILHQDSFLEQTLVFNESDLLVIPTSYDTVGLAEELTSEGKFDFYKPYYENGGEM